jgi:RimJ/RimL family protein N-acetyltransferase
MSPDQVVPYVFSAPVRTDRLVLRLLTEADADDVHRYQSREDVCRYALFEPRTHAEVVERLAKHAVATTLANDGDYLQLALELPATSDARARVIGDSFFTISSLANAKGEIGWTLHPDFAGRGYAAEAARAVLRIAFEDLRLHRVVAELDPRNEASIALCRRLGMREEALFAKDLWFKGDWADTGVYAILREEWLAAQYE